LFNFKVESQIASVLYIIYLLFLIFSAYYFSILAEQHGKGTHYGKDMLQKKRPIRTGMSPARANMLIRLFIIG